jgi:DNA-binding LytR/AlgR family response regulator
MCAKLRSIIIEDEAPARELLRSYSERVRSLEVIQIFENALDASDFLENNGVDLIITDVTMPRFSGIDLIRNLRKKPHVIIITADKEFALEGFELDVVDFLVKPVPFDRFLKAINKVIDRQANKSTKITTDDDDDDDEYSVSSIYVKESGKVIRIDFDEILSVESLKDYVKIRTEDRSVVTHMTMKKLEEEVLPKSKFIRVHRSFMVKIDKIRSVDGGNSLLELRNKIEIPIGAQYKDLVLSKLKPIN